MQMLVWMIGDDRVLVGDTPICPYFGEVKVLEGASGDMIMQGAGCGEVVEGSSSCVSGAVFANDPRGRKAANARIVLPRSGGIPYYKSKKGRTIKAGR